MASISLVSPQPLPPPFSASAVPEATPKSFNSGTAQTTLPLPHFPPVQICVHPCPSVVKTGPPNASLMPMKRPIRSSVQNSPVRPGFRPLNISAVKFILPPRNSPIQDEEFKEAFRRYIPRSELDALLDQCKPQNPPSSPSPKT